MAPAHAGIEPYRRGKTKELELARRFFKLGFLVVRAPGSGARTKTLLYPDLILVKKRCVLLVEVKYLRSKSHVYLDREAIERYRAMAERSGGVAILCVKGVSTGGWRCIEMFKPAWETDKYYVFPQEYIAEHGLPPEGVEQLCS